MAEDKWGKGGLYFGHRKASIGIAGSEWGKVGISVVGGFAGFRRFIYGSVLTVVSTFLCFSRLSGCLGSGLTAISPRYFISELHFGSHFEYC